MAMTLEGSQELYAAMLSSGDSPQITAINTGTRTDGLLVVQIFGLGITAVETFDVEYAGVPMAKNYESNFVGNQWFWCYSMPAPSDGIDNLEIDYWLAGAGEFAVLYWVASWYDGAKQSSPYDDSSNGSGSGDPSVEHTPNFNNCLVLGMYKTEANTVLTTGAGETLLHNEDFGTRTGGTSYVIQTTAEAQVVDYSGPDGDWYEFVVSYQEAAVGGYEQECAGSITPTGATVKNPTIAPIGSLAPTGAILRAVTAVKAGSMQPAGALLAEARKLLAGSVTPSGAIDYIKSYVRQLAGAIAPSGSLAKSAGKALAGALSPAGSLIKKPLAILSGNLTPIGEKIAGLTKLLGGVLTPTGALTGFKSFVQALSGSLAPTAALIKLPAKVLAGSIAPVGSVIRGIKKLLAGALAAAGALIGTGGEAATATVYLTVRPRPFDLDLRSRKGLEMALRTRSHDLALHDRED